MRSPLGIVASAKRNVIVPSSPYPAAVMADSPVLYLRLDELSGTSAADSSGNARTGTYVGTVAKGATSLLVDGNGTAVSLAGAGHVSGPTGSSSEPWQNSDYATVTARVKIDSSTALSGDCYIASSWSGSSVNNRWILNIHNGVLQGLVYTSSGMTTINGTKVLVVGASYTVGLTYDGTTAKLWLNGVLEGSAANSGVLNKQGITTWTIDVGRVALSDPTHANGITVDEFALFDTALSAARLAAQHDAGAVPPNLILDLSPATGFVDASPLHRGLYNEGTSPTTTTGTPTGEAAWFFNRNGKFNVDNAYISCAQGSFPGTYTTALLDGNNGTVWISLINTFPIDVQQYFPGGAILTGYGIRINGTSSGPNTWTFQGTNDGTTWTTLDTQTGITWSSTGERKAYTFSNTTSYKQYRIHVTVGNGDYMRWQGVDYTGATAAILGANRDGHYFVVVKTTDTSGGGGLGQWGTSGSTNHYAFGGDIYDSMGTATRRNFTPGVSVSSTFRIYEVEISGSVVTARIDGVQQYTASGITPAWATDVITIATHPGGQPFIGYIARILEYDGALGAAAAAVRTELTNRYITLPAVSLPISDSFTDVDNASSMGNTETGYAPWGSFITGTWGITGGKAYLVAASAAGISFNTVDAGVADCTISTVITRSSYNGIAFRCADANNLMAIEVQPGVSVGPTIFKRVAGSQSTVATGSAITFAAGDTLTVVLSGSSIIIKRNGTTVLSTTDLSLITNTKHGLYSYSTAGSAGSGRFDAFSITV